MTNPVAQIRRVNDHGSWYEAIMLWCPGCAYTAEDGGTVGGLHMLPISGDSNARPTWSWNGDLVNVTLTPSILTGKGTPEICHSFLTDGRWRFLSDSTHQYSGQTIEMVPLPDWAVRESS